MLEKVPTKEDIENLIGSPAIKAWNDLISFVESNYNFDPVWDDGGKYGVWEVKYRRSSKTLCAFYAKDGYFTVLIIFGKAEREKFELVQDNFSSEVVELYDSTHQYHDGKWLWVNVRGISLIEDVKRLIMIKKKFKKA